MSERLMKDLEKSEENENFQSKEIHLLKSNLN